MYEAPVFTAEGKKAKGKPLALPESIFDGTVHEAVLWQAAKAYLANRRKGTASTRNRSRVRGGSRKPWRQKGTGRARQGTIRAPQWRGGGVVFGPTSERNHRQELPRKVRSLARRSALNARADEGRVLVFQTLELEAPKTKRVIALLEGSGAEGNVLILTHGNASAVHLSARNIPQVRVVAFGQESAYDVLWSDTVLIESTALEAVTAQEPAPAAEKTKARPKAKKATAEAKVKKAAAEPKAETGSTAAKAEAKAKPRAKAKAKAAKDAESAAGDPADTDGAEEKSDG